MHHLARRGEHRRVGQLLLHELQAHQAVVHAAKRGPGEADHVDLDARASHPVEERTDERLGLAVMEVGAVDETRRRIEVQGEGLFARARMRDVHARALSAGSRLPELH